MTQRICDCIDKKKDSIIELGRTIYQNPETGFKEFNTTKLVEKRFKNLKLEIEKPEDIPGFKALIDTGREGPSVAILAELDSIICPDHPHSDSKTGVVHACGHNIPMAAAYGAALGILHSDAAADLCGRIDFIYVPAEEYIETDFRMGLRDRGAISYLGGKPEFMKRGFFKDVDISFMLHAKSGDKKVYTSSTFNGCLVKDIRYKGKAAHAGAAPEEGINSLYAANLGITAINSIRETFTENQCMRVPPIITKGGEIVNAIPSDVHVSTFVRGKTIEDINRANKRVDRPGFTGDLKL